MQLCPFVILLGGKVDAGTARSYQGHTYLNPPALDNFDMYGRAIANLGDINGDNIEDIAGNGSNVVIRNYRPRTCIVPTLKLSWGTIR